MFPKFDRDVHLIDDKAIPSFGTNYHFSDPAARNFFQDWFRFVPGKVYLYREWPGSYKIPGPKKGVNLDPVSPLLHQNGKFVWSEISARTRVKVLDKI